MIVYPFSFIKSATAPLDPDAEAFLNAVVATGGTIDATITSAVNTLFTDLKSTGIYNELLAFYPAVGSTEASTALNGIRTSNQFDILWIVTNYI
jgi:hypothetical protein